jgi:TRAP-type uncharacterized transport system fused permease subunit
MILIFLVPAILLFLAAVGHWQYGLASQFRWAVGALTFLLTLTALRRESAGWLVLLIIIFVIYNPLVPIRFSVTTLEILDLLACVFVLAAGVDMSE